MQLWPAEVFITEVRQIPSSCLSVAVLINCSCQFCNEKQHQKWAAEHHLGSSLQLKKKKKIMNVIFLLHSLLHGNYTLDDWCRSVSPDGCIKEKCFSFSAGESVIIHTYTHI